MSSTKPLSPRERFRLESGIDGGWSIGEIDPGASRHHSDHVELFVDQTRERTVESKLELELALELAAEVELTGGAHETSRP